MNARPDFLNSKPLRLLAYTFLVVSVWRAWMGPTEIVSTAHAQIPDSGTQRLRLIQQFDKANATLERIETLLRDGIIKVRPEGTDNKPATRKRTGRR
jgi:hypothetical protein